MKKFYLFALLFCLSLYSLTAQVTDVATGLDNPNTIALYGNSLYVGELTPGGDLKVIDLTQPLPAPATLVLENLRIAGLLTIGDELYMTIRSPSEKVVKIDLTDPNPTLIDVATNVPFPYGLYQNGDDLYISSQNTGLSGGIYKVDLTAPLPQMATQVLSGFQVAGMVVKDNELLFSWFDGITIRKIGLTQENPSPEVVITGLSGPDGMTLNGNFLYVSEYGGGKISRIDLGAETLTAETVVSGLTEPSLTAFDGTTLYFAQFNVGKVSRILVDDPVFPTQATICLDSDPEGLGGASPAGGVYSGPNVTDNGDGNTFSFDAATAGVGMHTITYTIDGAMVAGTVTVAESPTVTFSTGMLSLQEDAGVQAGLGGGMPAGGVYSGPGVTDDGNGMTYSFDPAAAGVGENVITYTVTDASSCSGAQSAVITVTPGLLPGEMCTNSIDINNLFGQAANEPQVSGQFDNTNYGTDASDPAPDNVNCDLEFTNTIWYSFTGDGNRYSIKSADCMGSPDQLDLTVHLYTGDCGNLTQVDCNDDDPNTGLLDFGIEFDTEAGVTYALVVDAIAGQPNTLGAFCLEVTLQCPAITFTPTLTGVCADAGVQAGLGGGLPEGGVYSGTGITDDGNGMTFSFDPATAGVGAQTVTYTVTESNIDQEQTDASETDFADFSLPTIQSFVPQSNQLCGASVYISQQNPISGDVTITLWDDLPNQAGSTALASGTATATLNSFVDVSWDAVTVTPGTTYFLDFSGTAAAMVMAGSQTNPYFNGGTYVDIGNGWTNFGIENLDVAFRTFTCSTGTCSGEATASIEVFALPEVTFVPSISTVALNAGVQSISGGSPAGGVYSGNGVTDDGNGMTFSFDPAAAGVGENVITYLYTDVNGCSGMQGAVITVEDCPEITFTPTLTGVCADADIQAGLSGGLPAGGVYSGTGITDDGNGMTFSFDPATAGVGAQTVTYAVTESNIDQEQTDNSEPFSLTAPRVAQSFIPTTDQICGWGIFITDNGAPDGEVILSLWDNLPNAPGTIMLAEETVTAMSGNYADVSWPAVTVIPGNTYYLVFDDPSPLLGIRGVSTNQYPDGVAYNGSLNPAGGWDLAFRTFTCSTGTCSGEATAQIEVFALPEVTFVPSISTVALNASVQSISGGMPVGGVYSGNGVTDDGNGMTFSFDPAAAGAGENVITYSYTDANGCSSMQGAVVTVEEALPGDVCPDANDINPLFGGAVNEAQVSSVQDNTGYNADNDPGSGYECWFGDEPVLNNTIWYAFTGDGEKYGIRSIACGDNAMTNTDTQFALYSGDCTTPVAVVCNDDEDFDNQVYNSYFEIVTEPGVEYLLMVDGYVAESDYAAIGTFCLEVTRLETVGTTDISQTSLEVYPNPTTGVIQINKTITERVEVYDNMGRLVQTYGQATREVDITSLPSGLYILKMYDDEEVVSARVIKE